MSKRKLLLADDSITIQKVVNLTFADEGIEVLTVGDGDSAMEKLREFSPDLIMADVNMPGLNGYQICESIKQDEFQKHIPVILLVGSFEPFDEKEAKRVGADDFLTKPFQSIRQLVNKVTGLLNSNDSKSSKNVESGFTQNLEVPPADEENVPKFDNTEFDDEMIQTNQVGGFSFDEVQKFEAKDTAVSEDFDYGKTQPLSPAEVKEFTFTEPENTAVQQYSNNSTTSDTEINSDNEEKSDYSNMAEDSNNEQEAVSEKTADSEKIFVPTEAKTEELPFPVSATILDLDDDFLELPPVEGEDTDEEEEAEDFTQDTSSQNTNGEAVEQETAAVESKVEEPSNSTASTVLDGFSSELIDAIAQRVIEKLSDKTIREIAWEVVPQQADLIIKKMVEEKLKE